MSETLRFGLDFYAGQPQIAQVSHQLGRPEIFSLTSEIASLAKIPPEAGLTVSMPDDEALVKTVRVRGNGENEIRQKVYFELAQSLLEPETNFRFDYLDTGNKHQIGLIYRRERILARSAGFSLPESARTSGPRVDLRSVALARAYRSFCRPEPGDLIALGDVTADLASIVLLYKGKIVALGNTSIGAHANTEDWFRPVAVALKTLVNFKLTALRGDGISVPLSALIITGDQISEKERLVLKQFFSAKVVPFSLNPPLVDFANLGGIQQPEQFLVALGLTVN